MENESNQFPKMVYDFKHLKDTDLMPYGTHKGKMMKDVPASYLVWMHENDKCSKSVREYVVNNWDTLSKQAKVKEKKPARRYEPTYSIDKYLRK